MGDKAIIDDNLDELVAKIVASARPGTMSGDEQRRLWRHHASCWPRSPNNSRHK